MSSFITRHIIRKITEMAKEKNSTLKSNGFIYFDEPITEKCTNKYNRIINRIDSFNPYLKDSNLSTSWYVLEDKTLLEAFDKIKNNKFFVYKKIDGKDYKARLKNK
jgi:hypothetical protein